MLKTNQVILLILELNSYIEQNVYSVQSEISLLISIDNNIEKHECHVEISKKM